MNSHKNSILSNISKHFFRALLQSVPIVPGPDLLDLFSEISKSRISLDEKVNNAFQSLNQTSELVAELELGLQERLSKVEKLKVEYGRYSELAKIEEKKAKHIVDQLEVSIGKNRLKDIIIGLIISLVVGLLIFILGIVFGPSLTSYVQSI